MEEMTISIYARVLARYLAKKDLTPYAFGKRAKIPVQAIYRILWGRKPQKATVTRICRATRWELKPKDFDEPK